MSASDDAGRETRSTEPPRARSTRLPSPDSIVGEFVLAAPRPAVGAPGGARVGEGPMPRGRYRILRTKQVDEYDEPIQPEDVAPAAAPPGDAFTGSARKAAKLSIAEAEVEHFDDLRELVRSLPRRKAMVEHDPAIETTPESDRVEEESRNVSVRAWIHAASRENDNDYHLIVGRAPGRSPMFMTMEVSGLPPTGSPHRAQLQKVRSTYQNFFRNTVAGLPGPSYDFYVPPVPVVIQGSIFFDMSHATGGRPGPEDLRGDMPTIWEVHPVTGIDFEP